MPITLTPTATGHAFTRNPLLLNLPGTGRRVFSIYGQGYTSEHPAYKGEVTAPATINLAEFIDAIISPISDPGEDGGMMAYGLQDGSVTIEVDDGSQEPYTWQIVAHRGGVSKQNYRKLQLANTDVFAVSGNSVSLPATYNQVDYHGKLCSVDLKAIRQHFLDEFDCIAGVFDILVDDDPAARIAIQEARPQRERYRLKFRNSYGSFEIVEITGAAQIAPTIGEEEDSSQYKRYMADIDDFEINRPRAEMSNVVNISTGYKTNDELRFILDAIASDEIYLLDLALEPVKVIATADELAYDHRSSGPQAFSLKLTPVDHDINLTGEIKTDVMPTRGGLFSEEFSEHFD